MRTTCDFETRFWLWEKAVALAEQAATAAYLAGHEDGYRHGVKHERSIRRGLIGAGFIKYPPRAR